MRALSAAWDPGSGTKLSYKKCSEPFSDIHFTGGNVNTNSEQGRIFIHAEQITYFQNLLINFPFLCFLLKMFFFCDRTFPAQLMFTI